jgi:tetraacyldisaccharide 4'-kinase
MQIPSDWRAEKVFAFCGIGNANAFANDLNRWRFQVAGFASFSDHHRYSQEEVSQVMNQALRVGATALICTEKDVFNLREIKFSGVPVGFARIVMRLPAGDAFWAAVLAKLKDHSKAVETGLI